MFADFRDKHVLMLQGPVGPFFRRLAHQLEGDGARVSKINFNAGDALYYPGGSAYRGSLGKWDDHLDAFLEREGVDAILLFGDMRPIHRTAREVAARHGVDVWVFEEGYLRPDYITVEKGGVNGNSSMPADPKFYFDAGLDPVQTVVPIGDQSTKAAWWCVFYSWAMTFAWFMYPRYRHHRDFNSFSQAFWWVLGGARKMLYRFTQRDMLLDIVRNWSGRYFLVPLQVHCDFQMCHCPYDDVTDFIEETVASFAAHAPANTALVFKHHPGDRPYRDYHRLLRRLEARYGLAGRIFYCHDLHLPTLIKHARGAVLINSTVGLSAIHHGCPVKTMGTAVYDIKGLTYQGPLDAFWRAPGVVDATLYQRVRGWMQRHNQVNGSVWTGIVGGDALREVEVEVDGADPGSSHFGGRASGGGALP